MTADTTPVRNLWNKSRRSIKFSTAFFQPYTRRVVQRLYADQRAMP